MLGPRDSSQKIPNTRPRMGSPAVWVLLGFFVAACVIVFAVAS